MVTQRDRDSSIYFVSADEIEDGINNSSLKQLFINSHRKANIGVLGGHLPPEYTFGFCRLSNKIAKGLAFELESKTSKRKQDTLYTTLGEVAVKNTISSLYLFRPTIFRSRETRRMFNEAITKSFT